MALLVEVQTYRDWAGAASNTVPDSLVQGALDEAEAGLCADLGVTVPDILTSEPATALATGEELRRASRLLARRNSPEGVAGYGDLALQVPSRDPDSYRTLVAIKSALLIPEGIA